MSSIDLHWRMESGEEHSLTVSAFVAGWTRNIGYHAGREVDIDGSKMILSPRGVIGTEPRLRPFDENGQAVYKGDSVDDDGLRVLPRERELYVQVVDEAGQQVACFPAQDGVVFQAGPNRPIEGAGYHEQLLLSDLSGNVLATCYANGWHDADGGDYPGGRGFILYVADEDWLAMKDGHFHPHQAARDQQRRRPSPLAALRVA